MANLNLSTKIMIMYVFNKILNHLLPRNMQSFLPIKNEPNQEELSQLSNTKQIKTLASIKK